jgi:hypothetical protein
LDYIDIGVAGSGAVGAARVEKSKVGQRLLLLLRQSLHLPTPPPKIPQTTPQLLTPTTHNKNHRFSPKIS